MASSNRVSWEKDIRDSIRTNFGAGWRVNGENSGKTKILYVYKESDETLQTVQPSIIDEPATTG